LQCRPSGAAPTEGESPRERAEELLARHRAEWLGPLDRPDWKATFERGLIRLEVPARELAAAAGELAGADALAWVETVWLESPTTSHLQGPLESPLLAGVRGLRLGTEKLGARALERLARSPHLGGLRRFYFSGNQANAALVRALAAGLSPERLTQLTLSFGQFDAEAADAMLAFRAFPRLRRLHVADRGLSDGSRAKLQAAFGRVLTTSSY
jgi:hypothetical protein